MMAAAAGPLGAAVAALAAARGDRTSQTMYGVDGVFINVAPANDNRFVHGLREFNLSDESLHDRQRLRQGAGVKFRDGTPHGHDVDVGEIPRKICKY